MKLFVLKKVFSFIITFISVISLIFFISRAIGDPFQTFMEDPRVTEDVVARIKMKFGLDKPLGIQYLNFLISMFKGDFGYSLLFHRPVFKVIFLRLPWTLFLLGTSTIISTIISYYLGVWLAWKHGSKLDVYGTNFLMFIRSTPHFWLGMVFLLLFGYYYSIFPLYGALTPGVVYKNQLEKLVDIIYHSILPSGVLIIRKIGTTLLYIRNASLDVIKESFVNTARAKGLNERRIVYHHVARNAMLPMVTITALHFGSLVDGAILTETVFSYPGTGKLIYEAILNNDYFLIQGAFFMIALCVLSANLIADLLYVKLDPRVKL